MSAFNSVPFLDLVAPHVELQDDLVSVFRNALATAGFVGGSIVEDFEREFAAFCDARHAVGVGSGTDAVRFAVIAAGVRPGDTVLTVPNTFIATAAAISQAGARPDFIDVDPCTYTLDPEALRAYLENECMPDLHSSGLINVRTGSRVTAVVPVHLYGQMADMDPIVDLARKYNLLVIEDACQAHGAQYFSRRERRWRTAGSIGHAAAFSFYPGKNLGACGEAGAVVTSDEQLARTCRMLRDHGQSSKYVHEIEGYNGRLDAIQAGVLLVKLRHLAGWNAQRRARALCYDGLLAGADSVTLPYVADWSRPVHHLYVVQVANREAVQKDLAAAGIATGIHYPFPLHLCKPYEYLGLRAGSFPVSEHAARHVLSLPMFPGISTEQQETVARRLIASVSSELTARAS